MEEEQRDGACRDFSSVLLLLKRVFSHWQLFKSVSHVTQVFFKENIRYPV